MSENVKRWTPVEIFKEVNRGYVWEAEVVATDTESGTIIETVPPTHTFVTQADYDALLAERDRAYEAGYADGESSLEADVATLIDQLWDEDAEGAPLAHVRALILAERAERDALKEAGDALVELLEGMTDYGPPEPPDPRVAAWRAATGDA